jgi:hypothetical protein
MVWNESKQAYFNVFGSQKMYRTSGLSEALGRWEWAHDGVNNNGWVDLKADGTFTTPWNNGTRWRIEVVPEVSLYTYVCFFHLSIYLISVYS